MKSKTVQLLVAVIALGAVVYGITQILGGVEEMQAGKSVTKTDARGEAEKAAASLKEFVAEDEGIAISHPKNWTAGRQQGQPFFTWKTFKGMVNGTLAQEELGGPTSLVEYVKANVDATTAEMTKNKMPPKVLGRDPVQVGGEDGMRVRYSYVYPGDKIEVHCSQIYFLHGNRGYVITWTTPADLHQSFEGLMTKMLASVRFLG